MSDGPTEAIRHAEHGLRLSPFDQNLFSYYNLLAIAHYAHGDLAEAIRWCRLSDVETPRFTSNLRDHDRCAVRSRSEG